MKSTRSAGRSAGAKKTAAAGGRPGRQGAAEPGPKPAQRGSGGSLREKLELPAAFENKAGKYELIRIDGEEVYYEFTNRHGVTASRVMPAVTWRILGSRAKPPE